MTGLEAVWVPYPPLLPWAAAKIRKQSNPKNFIWLFVGMYACMHPTIKQERSYFSPNLEWLGHWHCSALKRGSNAREYPKRYLASQT